MAAVLAMSGAVGQAAEFQRAVLPDGSPAILMSGPIVPEDDAAFRALASGMGTATVILAGLGGRVGPALAISDGIRARGWATLVPASGRCASACALIWLAGRTRRLGPGAQIGFHAMSMIRDGQRTETHALDGALRQWLGQTGYAADATATIVNTSADSIRWYDAIELRANGIASNPFP